MRLYSLVCFSLLAIHALSAAPAGAAEPPEPQIWVMITGLPDPEVRARLHAAAEAVCKAEYDGLDYRADPIDHLAFGACVEGGFSRAMASLAALRRPPAPTLARVDAPASNPPKGAAR